MAQPGLLYAWGNGLLGTLGHADTSQTAVVQVVEGLRDHAVTQVVCSDVHTLALTSDGKVYSWGVGSEGQLGHGNVLSSHLPAPITALHGHRVVAIACGAKHSAALTAQGLLFTWGDNKHGQLGHGNFWHAHTPTAVVGLSAKATHVSCGRYHTACVLEDHQVYAWGAGGAGQLGLEGTQDVPTPTPIAALAGQRIKWVGCFAEHTMALSDAAEAHVAGAWAQGDDQAALRQKVNELEVKLQREVLRAEAAESKLQQAKATYVEEERHVTRLQRSNEALQAERADLYMKMQNLEAQLSVVSTDKDHLDKELSALISVPTKLEEISSQGVRQIACGSGHVLVLCDTGDVYSWGSGREGQLGLGKLQSYTTPQLVWGMMRKGVRQIGAGSQHSAALTFNGHLYTWGASTQGQLGHGNRRTQPLPKLVDSLDNECRERSTTVRLVGCGASHSVAVLGNGDLFIWGRPDFGRLGHTRKEMSSTPVLVDALWRRELADGEEDRKAALSKVEIGELLEQNLNVHDILRYFPDIESDPEAALYLSKAVAIDLQKKNQALQNALEQAHAEKATALQRFMADQEKAFEEKEQQGLEELLLRKQSLESQVETHEKSLFYQTQLSIRLAQELHQLATSIEKVEDSRIDRLSQARANQKAAPEKMLRLELEQLKQSHLDKEGEMRAAKLHATSAQRELEEAQQQLSNIRVEIRKHERHGFRASIERTHKLIASISALSQRLSEAAIENIDPSKSAKVTSTAGLRRLVEVANADIDRICTQAAEFASDEHVDVVVRQQLATLIFDNAEMRKQLNSYTEGILLQAVETVSNNRTSFLKNGLAIMQQQVDAATQDVNL